MNFARGADEGIALGVGAISSLTNNYTLCVWVRVTSFPGGNAMCWFSLEDVVPPYAGNDGVINATNGTLGSWYDGGYKYGTTAVVAGQWTFCAIRGFANVAGSIQVSVGAEAWQTIYSGNTLLDVPFATQQHLIGRWIGDGYGFNGDLADLRYYDRRLSLAEIQTIQSTRGRDMIVSGIKGRWLVTQDPIGVFLGNPAGVSILGTMTAFVGASTTVTSFSGINRMFVVVSGWEDGVNSLITNSSVTYGGVAMTLGGRVKNTAGASPYPQVEVWYMLDSGLNSLSGNTLTATYGTATGVNNEGMCYGFLSNVNQNSPITATATAVGTANPVSTPAIANQNVGMFIGGAFNEFKAGGQPSFNDPGPDGSDLTQSQTGQAEIAISTRSSTGASSAVSFSTSATVGMAVVGMSVNPASTVTPSVVVKDLGPDGIDGSKYAPANTLPFVEHPLSLR